MATPVFTVTPRSRTSSTSRSEPSTCILYGATPAVLSPPADGDTRLQGDGQVAHQLVLAQRDLDVHLVRRDAGRVEPAGQRPLLVDVDRDALEREVAGAGERRGAAADAGDLPPVRRLAAQ